MTDKEIVERAKEAEKRTGFGELVHSPMSKGVNSAFGIGFIEGMVEYRNSMQEEPTIPDIVDEHFCEMLGEEPSTSVWHKVTEEPKAGKWILLQHSEGWYHVGLMSKGKFDKLWVSDGTAAFLLPVFSKWAYIDDLIKL